MPRVVVAAPVFNKARYLEDALRSLLEQTFRDLAVLVIDDGSSDETVAITRRLAASDPRLELHVNERRLGMLANTNRALALARERFPDAEYWALGSDHDVWDERFVERLVALLDTHPDAVLAYPLAERIDECGAPYAAAKTPREFSTLGVADPLVRMRLAFRGMSAGNMIYGLFRLSALDGLLYRPVLVPDRLLLSELSLRGTFANVPEVLWRRRFRGLAELDRQRRAFFLGAVPPHARMPWWLQHVGALVAAYVLRGEGRRAGITRPRGLIVAALYFRLALQLRARRRWGRLRRHTRRWGPRRLARRMLGRYGPSLGLLARRGLDALASMRATRALTKRLVAPAFERLATRLRQDGGG